MLLVSKFNSSQNCPFACPLSGLSFRLISDILKHNIQLYQLEEVSQESLMIANLATCLKSVVCVLGTDNTTLPRIGTDVTQGISIK